VLKTRSPQASQSQHEQVLKTFDLWGQALRLAWKHNGSNPKKRTRGNLKIASPAGSATKKTKKKPESIDQAI
jgi:hypothetical protein